MSWSKVNLGEVCIIEKGAIGIQKAIPGKYPMVVTSEERKSHNEFQFDDEAVIIPLVSGTGHGHASIKRIHFQRGKFALGNILCAVIPKDKKQLSAEYLYRFLDLNKENELVARMRGMANVTLPIKEIAQIEIPLPSLREQNKFVENYKNLENKSDLLSSELKHQLFLVKKLRQQLLQDAVHGKLVAQNKKDEPADELLKKIKTEKEQLIKDKKLVKDRELPIIKEEEIPFAIPKSWVWCRFGDIILENQGGLEKNKLEQNDNFEYQYFKMNDIFDFGFANLEKLKRVNATKQEVEKYRLAKSDFLFNTRNSKELVGKSCVIKDELLTPILYNNNIARLKLAVNSTYINYYFCSPFNKAHLLSLVSATTNVAAIYLGQLINIPIPIPPLSEQNRIIEKLEQQMRNCNMLEESINQSASQNEKLLQQVLREALRGKN